MGTRRLLRSFRASHTQLATQCSDVRMLGSHLLATRGAKSRADGSVRASGTVSFLEALDPAGNKTLRSGETCEIRFLILGTATASPRRKAQQNPVIRRRLPPGLPVPERIGRSVSGGIGCARSPTNLEFHVPTGGCRNWAGNSNLPPASTLRRQRGHGSTISNAGCCSEERSLVASTKHAQVRTQHAQVRAQQSNRNGLRKTASVSPNIVGRVRKNLAANHAGVASRCARAFGGTRLAIILRTCLQKEEKLLELLSFGHHF